MTRAVLVLNAGSATLKYAVYGADLACLARGTEEGSSHHHLLARVLARLQSFRFVAAGHRVVHGGDAFAAPVRLDAEIVEALRALCPLAPLHQPHNLAGIHAVSGHLPRLPQVACFDTAFHQTQADLARRFAIPAALHDAGIKRYGFHGLSYESIVRKIDAKGRTIIAHLGNGSSLCAVRDGRSVASTMGFTALEGLMMGTRSGAIDPGVLLYLLDQKRMSVREVERLLYRESGLLGVSGISHDMRTLLASSDPRAKLAVDLYVYRIVREAGSLAAALGGLDRLVFTGGIGEHAAPVREAVCAQLAWLGAPALVVPTDEQEMIARHTLETLGSLQEAA